jgi:hypothetical protein
MKQIIGVDIGSYTFNKTAKTVTITGVSALTLEQILLIINATSNQIIYQHTYPDFGGTINNNVITLDCDTSTMNNSDNLYIAIESNNLVATSALQTIANTSLSTIVTNTNKIPSSLTVNSNRLLVDSSGVTQPVSIASGSNVIGSI